MGNALDQLHQIATGWIYVAALLLATMICKSFYDEWTSKEGAPNRVGVVVFVAILISLSWYVGGRVA